MILGRNHVLEPGLWRKWDGLLLGQNLLLEVPVGRQVRGEERERFTDVRINSPFFHYTMSKLHISGKSSAEVHLLLVNLCCLTIM